MKLSDAQFSALCMLAEYGPSEATEILGPRGMHGIRKVTLQWHAATGATLAKLEAARLVTIDRGPATRPRDATGRLGRERRLLRIEITARGRLELDVASGR